MQGALFRWLQWERSRRTILASICAAIFAGRGSAALALQEAQQPDDRHSKFPDGNEDPRLPDGKSQKNAIAKEQHEQALRDADQMVEAAEDLRSELRKSGTFVVPLTAVKRTEEIEKLAKRIRGKLKG